MIITKKNYLRYYLDSLTMTNEDDSYPLNNCYNNILIEKTLYTATVNVVLTENTPANLFVAINSNADTVTVDDFVTATESITTSYNNWFWGYFSSLGGKSSLKISLSGDGALYINYVYFGDRFKFNYIDPGSVANKTREDIINNTVSKQIIKTAGISHRETNISISDYPQSDWDTWRDWQGEPEAADNQFFVLYEDEPTKYPPYYAAIEDYNTKNERQDLIDFDFIAREAK